MKHAKAFLGFGFRFSETKPLVSVEIEEHDEQALKYVSHTRLEHLYTPVLTL